MISPLFTTIVLAAGFIWIFMKLTTRNNNKELEEFLEKEQLSNTIRKQPLDNLPYILVNADDFSIPNPAPNERIQELHDRILQLSTCKIVNFTGVTNTDLKMTYGVANLNVLTEYDQNFTSLCRSVYDLGSEMANLGYTTEAISILEKGISFGTDISGNYLLLADLYLASGQTAKISGLIISANNMKSLTKESTIAKLNSKINLSSGLLIKDSDGSVSSLNPDSILPADILDILETVPYKSDDQRK